MSLDTPRLAGPAQADTPLREKVLRRLRSRPTTRGAAILLGIMVLLALLAPVIAPQNPHDLGALSVMDNRLAPGERGMSGFTYWLGSDAQGRDMLSAILYGLRTSLLVGLSSTLGALAIGIMAGLAAAQFGGVVDAVLMRIVDFMLGFPRSWSRWCCWPRSGAASTRSSSPSCWCNGPSTPA